MRGEVCYLLNVLSLSDKLFIKKLKKVIFGEISNDCLLLIFNENSKKSNKLSRFLRFYG